MLFRKIILMMSVVFLGGIIFSCGKDSQLSPASEEAVYQVAEKDSVRAAKSALTISVPGFSLTAAGQEAVECSWDAVTQAPIPRDWRIRWKKTSDPAYPSWTNDSGNAYPKGTSYVIRGLECGVEYEATIRPRYHDSAGDWTEASGSTSPCETTDKGGSTTPPPPINARVPRAITEIPTPSDHESFVVHAPDGLNALVDEVNELWEGYATFSLVTTGTTTLTGFDYTLDVLSGTDSGRDFEKFVKTYILVFGSGAYTDVGSVDNGVGATWDGTNWNLSSSLDITQLLDEGTGTTYLMFNAPSSNIPNPIPPIVDTSTTPPDDDNRGLPPTSLEGVVTFSANPETVYEDGNNGSTIYPEGSEYVFTFSPPRPEEISVNISFGKEGDTAEYGVHHKNLSHGFVIPANIRSYTYESGFNIVNKVNDDMRVTEDDVTLTIVAKIVASDTYNRETSITLDDEVTIADYTSLIPINTDIKFEWDNADGFETFTEDIKRATDGIILRKVGNVDVDGSPEDLPLKIVSLSPGRLVFLVGENFSETNSVNTTLLRGHNRVDLIISAKYDIDTFDQNVNIRITVTGSGTYAGSQTSVSVKITDIWPEKVGSGARLILSPTSIVEGELSEFSATITLEEPLGSNQRVFLYIKPIPEYFENDPFYVSDSVMFNAGETEKTINFTLLTSSLGSRKTILFEASSKLHNSDGALGEASVRVIDTGPGEIEFDPPDTLVIRRPETSASVDVVLRYAPGSDVNVSINSYGYTPNPSTLDFTEENWNDPRRVVFSTSESYLQSSNAEFNLSSVDLRFRGGYTYHIYEQIPDQPPSIPFSSKPPERLNEAFDRFSTENWGTYAGLSPLTRLGEDGKVFVTGFSYGSFTPGLDKPTNKFINYVENTCVSFGTDAVLSGVGGLNNMSKATWSDLDNQWNLESDVDVTLIESPLVNTHFMRINVRKGVCR